MDCRWQTKRAIRTLVVTLAMLQRLMGLRCYFIIIYYYRIELAVNICGFCIIKQHKWTNVHPVGHYKERFNLEETFATVTQHCRPRCLTSCRVYRHYSRLALFKVSYITRRFVARIFSWELLPICFALPHSLLSSPKLPLPLL